MVVQTISLKLPEQLLAELESQAKARGVSKSSLIRESLQSTLARSCSPGRASCFDLASDLAGSVKGLPEDLADNPAYMDDFGQ